MERLPHLLVELAALGVGAATAMEAGAIPPPCAEKQLGMTLWPGARVFDMVTGQEGTVVAGSKANVIIPPTSR